MTQALACAETVCSVCVVCIAGFLYFDGKFRSIDLAAALELYPHAIESSLRRARQKCEVALFAVIRVALVRV